MTAQRAEVLVVSAKGVLAHGIPDQEQLGAILFLLFEASSLLLVALLTQLLFATADVLAHCPSPIAPDLHDDAP